MYTNIDTLNLTGCTALKQVIIPYNQLKTLDFTECPNLEEVNVVSNQLTQIIWGDCEYLNKLKCTGNYLDIDTDETFLSVIKTLENKGYVPMYVDQNANPELSYSEDDMAFVKKFLEQENNAEALGWDAEDISTWEGVSWKTVGDENRIKRFDVSYAEVSGTLDVTSLTYVREVVCTSTNISKVNISGCKYLMQLACDNCQLETIQMKDNHSLLYLDCLYNYLDLDEIETYCQEISSRYGALVYYDVQYINASREAFNSEECDALEMIAESQENIDWDMEKPGAIPGITWTIKDGEYRVESMNLSGYEIAYRRGKKGKFKKVVLKGWKKNKTILRRMKKGKYFVKIRAYKIVGGKKYYSKYSKVKKFRMK